MKSLWILILAHTLCSSSLAFAKSKREGFNFGTTLRLIDVEQPAPSGGEGHSTNQIQTVRPYLGYAFDEVFHLGLGMTFENENREDSVRSSDNSRIESTKESSLQGGGVVTRFLFGRVMYFEGGVGYYQRRSTLETRHLRDSGNDFTGTESEEKTQAIGFGYHLGAGVEIPIAYGFFFTTNYMVYFYNLKPYKNAADSRADAEYERQREVSFGFAHYYR